MGVSIPFSETAMCRRGPAVGHGRPRILLQDPPVGGKSGDDPLLPGLRQGWSDRKGRLPQEHPSSCHAGPGSGRRRQSSWSRTFLRGRRARSGSGRCGIWRGPEAVSRSLPGVRKLRDRGGPFPSPPVSEGRERPCREGATMSFPRHAKTPILRQFWRTSPGLLPEEASSRPPGQGCHPVKKPANRLREKRPENGVRCRGKMGGGHSGGASLWPPEEGSCQVWAGAIHDLGEGPLKTQDPRSAGFRDRRVEWSGFRGRPIRSGPAFGDRWNRDRSGHPGPKTLRGQ